jgi:hypothetical protein
MYVFLWSSLPYYGIVVFKYIEFNTYILAIARALLYTDLDINDFFLTYSVWDKDEIICFQVWGNLPFGALVEKEAENSGLMQRKT